MSHLEETGYTYIDHFRRSMWFSIEFAMLSMKAAIHAMLPNYFTTSTTNGVIEMQAVVDRETW